MLRVIKGGTFIWLIEFMVLITRVGSALDHFGRTNLVPPICPSANFWAMTVNQAGKIGLADLVLPNRRVL
jgi:hypothetical protein